MTDKSHVAPGSLIFCCSGASKVGVLSFQRSGWPQEGFEAFSRIAGIGSRNPPMIRKAKLACERVVIDGCPSGCGRKIMEMNQIPVDRYIMVTELGIDKTHEFDIENSDIETVVKKAKRAGRSSGEK